MRFFPLKRFCCRVLGVCLTLLAAAGTGSAEDNEADLRGIWSTSKPFLTEQGNQLKQLKARLESLGGSINTIGATTAPGDPAARGATSSAPKISTDEAAVKKIVADYLNFKTQQDDAKKQADAAEFKEVTNNPPLLGKMDVGRLQHPAVVHFAQQRRIVGHLLELRGVGLLFRVVLLRFEVQIVRDDFLDRCLVGRDFGGGTGRGSCRRIPGSGGCADGVDRPSERFQTRFQLLQLIPLFGEELALLVDQQPRLASLSSV